MKASRGWIRFVVVLVLLCAGALIFTLISGPVPVKKADVPAVGVLAPFYQNGAFLIAVVSDHVSWNADLAKKLLSAGYEPITDPTPVPPYDVTIGVWRNSIVVMPEQFFYCNGRYTEVHLPTMFQETNPDAAVARLREVAEEHRRSCLFGDNAMKNMT